MVSEAQRMEQIRMLQDALQERNDELKRVRDQRDEARHGEAVATATLQGWIEERTTLRAERDEARRRTNSILTEIDCRIEHGAESNGHLEVLRDMFKENTDE